jgi:hypothetical protein
LITQTITVLGQQYEIKALEGNNIGIVNNIIVQDIYSLYQGLGKNYAYRKNSALIHNLKIYFTSPPQYYNISSNNNISLNSGNEFLDNNYALGYRLVLYYDNNGTPIRVPIFIASTDGRTGYYQVPSNLAISEIELYDNTTAILNYYLTYKIDYYNADIADFYSQEETLVGQVGGY